MKLPKNIRTCMPVKGQSPYLIDSDLAIFAKGRQIHIATGLRHSSDNDGTNYDIVRVSEPKADSLVLRLGRHDRLSDCAGDSRKYWAYDGKRFASWTYDHSAACIVPITLRLKVRKQFKYYEVRRASLSQPQAASV